MSLKSIVKTVLKALPEQFIDNYDTIYFQSFRYVLRGMLIERSSSKTSKYLRDFTYPLFRFDPSVHVSYSPRLSLTGRSDGGASSFSGTDDEIAAKMLNAIELAGLVEHATAGCTPEQFIQHRVPNGTKTTNPYFAFDVACAAGLCGDDSLALWSFVTAREQKHWQAAQFKPARDDDVFFADIDVATQALQDGPEAFQAHIDRVSQAVAAAHGFCPPTMS